VDEAHTYFVGDGAWLVHNACEPRQLTPESRRIIVNPHDVRYSQDSIGDEFQNKQSIRDVSDDLRAGTMTPSDFDQPIRVVEYNGHYYTLDHRRLWAIRESGRYDEIEVVLEDLNNPHIRDEFNRKLTVRDNYNEVRVRSSQRR
ncbi:MAG TPA: hypothetical protein PLZ51_14645, partial [Aggregatilineales bacterium]|nr:hypothetical protein [Aggregatilineales bacterium]